MALEFINIYHAHGFLLSSKKPITTFIILFFSPPQNLKHNYLYSLPSS